MASDSRQVLGRLAPAVSVALAARADAWRPGDRPATPAASASVVLLRPGGEGLETYLLHRHARMAFAASVVVFPGGGVDPVDQRAGDPVRACAVRETREETGVQLREDDLHDWAHWTTPEVEPRRYDTRFFLAALPPGQQAEDISGETERAEWATPGGALERARRGEIDLLPPTLSILLELAELPSIPAAWELARGRTVAHVTSRLQRDEHGGWAYRFAEGTE
jgi:8-oxo-dGTP pyrophosphatase MutT (NUDIX family)